MIRRLPGRAAAAALLLSAAWTASGCALAGAFSPPTFVRPGAHRVREQSQAARDAIGRAASLLDAAFVTLALPIPYFTLAFGRDDLGRRWRDEAALRERARDLGAVLGLLGPPTEWNEGAEGPELRWLFYRTDYFYSEFALRAPYYGWIELFEWDSSSFRYDELRVVCDAEERVLSWAYREDVPAR